MNGKYLIATVVTAILLMVGGFLAIKPVLQQDNGPQVGALAGPDIPYDYLRVGGVLTFYRQTTLAATSSVPCALQGPAATSTLVRFAMMSTANGMGAITLDVSTSTTAFASSSPSFVRASSIAAGAQKSLFWSPGIASTTDSNVLGYDKFATTGESPYIVGPNEWVTMRVATGTPGTFSSYLTGACSAEFRTL